MNEQPSAQALWAQSMIRAFANLGRVKLTKPPKGKVRDRSANKAKRPTATAKKAARKATKLARRTARAHKR